MRRLVPFVLLAVLVVPAHGQDRPIVIKVSAVLDGKGNILRNTNIVIEGGKIARLDPKAAPATYDLTGLTVMPGWIDTHVHVDHHISANGRAWPFAMRDETPAQTAIYGVSMAYQTLMAGFTTVQSLGGRTDKDLRDAVARGDVPGARILTSLGSVNDRTGPPEKLREAIRDLVKSGADVVKIFASKSIREGGDMTMSVEQLQAACGEAKALGKRSPVHAHSAESAKQAALAGCSSVEHGAYVDDETFSLMEERGTYYDPNIGLVLQNYLQNKPAFYGAGNYTDEGFAFMEKGVTIVLETFKKALKHKKLKIVFGTDATAGANGRNYEEFIVRVRDGGQAPMDAIVGATSLAAESLGLEGKIGSITPGLEADIIATDGDPLKDITAVRHVVFVMKGGKVFKNVSPARTATH